VDEGKERRGMEGEGTRGGQERRGKGQGPARCLADRRPVTYQHVRSFCVGQHTLLYIIALCLINN
jgi:hypothetical protein